MSDLSRRRFLQAAGLVPLAAAMPHGFIAEALAATPTKFDFFNTHQANVVRDATARLIPGPDDDPAEAGHPGAREANVVRYIDLMLSAFAVNPPRIHAGGPWSNRNVAGKDYMRGFLALSPFQEQAWHRKIDDLRGTYLVGIHALDVAAGGDFPSASTSTQDKVLAKDKIFRPLLFVHAIEGMYAIPEYGGNENLVGWKEISFKGDTQPRGYTAAEVTNSDGLDPVALDDLLKLVLANFHTAALAVAARRRGGR